MEGSAGGDQAQFSLGVGQQMAPGKQDAPQPVEVDATAAGAVAWGPNHGHARYDGQGVGKRTHPHAGVEVGFLLLGDDGAAKGLLPLGNAVGTVSVGKE